MNIPQFAEPILMITGILLATSVVWGPGLYFGLQQERRKRDQEHEVRLRALELGHPLPGSVSWWTPVRLAAAIGVFVPLGTVTIAMIATLVSTSELLPFVVWPATGAISVAGIICGTVLASQFGTTETTTPAAFPPDQNAKPSWYDPEAFDVVSQRS